ncbi:BZ3500_MvSof-1268-A1-R1_Chr11-1g03150 [Microbotryum saponariae]|uniref:Guanylate kinase n=1 Tax=Microbotryum saponariae TaxID=289078 RepID=A0A2X0LF44_9BASI|nr:BZ3501_MvSof-1269-A2-R1_Chr11g02725 [Microbotryum saponariae]SDA03710.1 BZ3500_MvSof-1268-A1-R1_Chr11-1g03150 [Microbotryum saponariae]
MSPLPAALRPIVICGPSGTGKSTLLQLLFKDYPDKFGFSISHTTRSPRPGETNGQSYHFTTREKFLKLVQEGAFIEHAEFSGNLYGTTVGAVEAVAKQANKTCILDIDTQGVKLIKANHPSLHPIYIFISPPSLPSLHARLTQRGTESDSSLSSRLSAAVREINYAQTVGAFDVVIVNDDLRTAYEKLKKVVVEGDLKAGDSLPDFSREE